MGPAAGSVLDYLCKLTGLQVRPHATSSDENNSRT